MKILISGYYGSGNLGDEAVLTVIVKELRSNRLTVISASPHWTKEQYGVEAIPRLAFFRLISAVWQNDLLISGGGSLFQDATSLVSFWYYLLLVWLAMALGKKVVVFAQGFGPLRRPLNRLAARLVLNRVNLITLRDAASVEQIKQLGINRPPIHLTADPAWLLTSDSVAGKKILQLEGVAANRYTIGVALRAAVGSNLSPEIMANCFDRLARKTAGQVIFLLMHCPQDLALAQQIADRMEQKAAILFRLCTPQEMLSVIGQLNLVIAMRLHALIFAASQGVPLFGLIYDPKVAAFLAELEQPGSNLSAGVAAVELQAALEEAINKQDNIKKKLPACLANQQIKAAKNFLLLQTEVLA